MANQYKNKIIYGDQTLMDITDTTATENNVLEGEVFYSASGARTVGSLGDATQTTHGLMSTADKTKLDGFLSADNYLTSHQDISGKANTADLATVATSGDYTDLLNKPDLSQYLTSVPTMTGATSSTAGASGLAPAPAAGDEDKFLAGDGTYKSGGRPMVILSYGSSTWAEFEAAYNNNVIVYCRASSNSNPASGSQTRMAFMAYVNDATNPTNVEFQYYRSVNTHSATQMGDQVFVYKLDKTSGWSVTTREASIKSISAASNSKIGVSWSNNAVTLSNTMTAADMPMSSSDATTVSAVLDDKLDAPATAGTNGQVLTSDGNGGQSWTSPTIEDNSITKAKLANSLAEEIDNKAPAIIGEETGYYHENVDSIVFNGNQYAWGTAKYANKKNLIVGTDTSASPAGVTIVTHGNIAVINGTGTGSNDWGMWTYETDIPAGSYTFSIEPYSATTTMSTGKNMYLDLWYDGNTTTTQSLRITMSGVKATKVSNTFTITDHTYKIRVWIGSRAETYDDYRLFYSLLPSDTVITDTEETVASNATVTYDLQSTLASVDTLMHQSTAMAVLDTKTYVDNHTQEVDFVCLRPEDFGAIGDGSTDDTTALQACINAAQQNTPSKVAIRGYGHYKITSTITVNARELDLFINRITYTGSTTALRLSASFSKFEFQTIEAYSGGSNVVAIEVYQNANAGYTNTYYANEFHCTYMRSSGNSMVFTIESGAVPSIMYNKFYFENQRSDNANIFYFTGASINENDFFGKAVYAPNGYLADQPITNGEINNRLLGCRFHEYCLESDLKNGFHGNTKIFDCRTAEMMNLQTLSDRTTGRVFVFDYQIPIGLAMRNTSGIDLTAIDVSNAYTFEQALNLVKANYDAGLTSWNAWSRVFPQLGAAERNAFFIESTCRSANANMLSRNSMITVPKGSIYVYYNNIAYKPNEEIYYVVDSDMTIELSEENDWVYITPTVFDINTSVAEIYLDSSYCCLAINEFDVIQYENKKAIIYDKFGNEIFDGTDLDAGTYHFKCSMTDSYDDAVVTDTSGVEHHLLRDWSMALYTGSNEVWSVTSKPSGDDFVGATASSDGVHGYVPAPTISDRTKYLCGDGTWAIPEGGKLVVFDLDTVTNSGGSYIHTTTLSDATHDMKAVSIEVTDSTAFGADIQITTADGSITLSCDEVNGTSDVTVSCLFVANASTITSSEFDMLANRIGSLSSLTTTSKSDIVSAVNEVNSKASGLVDLIYPVGAIYLSVVDTSPAVLFGGTWEKIAAGYTLKTISSGDGGTLNSAGDTGGHAITSSEMPSHKHSVGAHAHGLNNHTHSVKAHSHGLNSHTHGVGTYATASDGNHTHNRVYNGSQTYQFGSQAVPSGTGGGNVLCIGSGLSISNNGSVAHTHTISGASGAASGSTANSTAFDSGAASGNTANSSAFDSGATGGDSGGTTVAHSHTAGMPANIEVHMWKRTA